MKRVCCALLALFAAAGCATPPPPLDPVAPLPIDLEPRCLEIAGAPPIAPPSPAAAGAVAPWESSEGVAGWSVSTPSAGLESLAWGFPASDASDAFALELAAALLGGGYTAADPEAFRARRSALGGASAVHVEDGWLWLELQHLPQQRDAAAQLLAEWVETRPAAPDVFASIRRSVALARLAEEASATRLAARAFERLYEKPPGAAAGLPPPTPTRGEWSPASLDAFLRQLLTTQNAVGLRSSATERLAHEASAPAAQRAVASPPAHTPTLEREPGALYLVDRPGSPQVEILMGYPTVAPGAADAPALEMLASLLGGNVGGRLFRDLRERQGLAYILNAFQQPEGRFVVTTRARADRVPALVVGIEAHLRALGERPLLDCEVRDLQQRMAGEEALRADDPEALRAQLRAEIRLHGRPRSSSERASAFARVDRDALEAAAHRHLEGAPIVVLVGDQAALREPLATVLPERPLRVFDAELAAAE